jgi:hypothetical protein
MTPEYPAFRYNIRAFGAAGVPGGALASPGSLIDAHDASGLGADQLDVRSRS